MKNVSTISANAIVISSIIALLILQSCDVGEPFKAASTVQTPEINTPTGCLKNQGRYYDPKQKQCIKVDNQHQARVLDAYRYVNKIAEEGKLNEVEYRINFKNYYTLDTVEKLWEELRSQGAKMSIVSGIMPDSNQEAKSPKIWSGLGLAIGWQQSEYPNSLVKNGSISEMLHESLGDTEEINTSLSSWLQEAIFVNNDYRIGALIIDCSPVVMRDFWNKHIDEIEGIQPRITTLDFAQPTLGPTQSLKEGE